MTLYVSLTGNFSVWDLFVKSNCNARVVRRGKGSVLELKYCVSRYFVYMNRVLDCVLLFSVSDSSGVHGHEDAAAKFKW